MSIPRLSVRAQFQEEVSTRNAPTKIGCERRRQALEREIAKWDLDRMTKSPGDQLCDAGAERGEISPGKWKRHAVPVIGHSFSSLAPPELRIQGRGVPGPSPPDPSSPSPPPPPPPSSVPAVPRPGAAHPIGNTNGSGRGEECGGDGPL